MGFPHDHDYASRRRVDIIQVTTYEVWGTWTQVLEVWRYTCKICKESMDVQVAVNGPPHR